MKRIEHVVLVSDPMFYLFQSDRTKNKKSVSLFTTHFFREKSRNEGQLWPPVTRPSESGTTQSIPYQLKQLSKSRLFLWAIFGLVISEVLFSENSNFQDLSVLGENYAFYHFLCHRYAKY